MGGGEIRGAKERGRGGRRKWTLFFQSTGVNAVSVRTISRPLVRSRHDKRLREKGGGMRTAVLRARRRGRTLRGLE